MSASVSLSHRARRPARRTVQSGFPHLVPPLLRLHSAGLAVPRAQKLIDLGQHCRLVCFLGGAVQSELLPGCTVVRAEVDALPGLAIPAGRPRHAAEGVVLRAGPLAPRFPPIKLQLI